MIKQIDKKNKIFKSNDFIKDKCLYSEILDKDLQIFSDEDSYIIFCDKETNTIWIWFKDRYNKIFKWVNNKIDSKVLDDVKELLFDYLGVERTCNLVCKDKLYKALLDDSSIAFNLDDYVEKSFYTCEELIEPSECDGYAYAASVYDIGKITDYYYNNCLENDDLLITKEQVEKYVHNLIDQDNDKTIFAWKNQQNEIVSLLIYFENEDYAMISNLFTPIDYRNCGYSSNLLCKITQEALNSNLVPIVISNDKTDFFTKLGYDKSGTLVSSSCSLQNIKRR